MPKLRETEPGARSALAATACALALLAGGCASLGGAGRLPPVGGMLERSYGQPNVYGRGAVVRADAEDSLVELARRHDLGFTEIVAANPGVDPWLPGDDTRVVLPGAHLVPGVPREGIVINLAEQRLYAFEPGGPRMLSFPIGVSRDGWKTPLGTTRVVDKRESPTWVPPASARREDPSLPTSIPPGDENPLGTHALYLEWPRYLIHGTNEPYGVGRRVSRGCIRLYPEDILRLYPLIPVGTPVLVIHDPIKLAMVRGEVFVEVHPTLDQGGELAEEGRFTPSAPDGLRRRLESLAAELAPDGALVARIDWELVERLGRERRGVPVRVSR